MKNKIKVWFGKKHDGTVCDLNEMTYEEVADRMVELLFVAHQNRWIHSYFLFLFNFFSIHLNFNLI